MPAARTGPSPALRGPADPDHPAPSDGPEGRAEQARGKGMEGPHGQGSTERREGLHGQASTVKGCMGRTVKGTGKSCTTRARHKTKGWVCVGRAEGRKGLHGQGS